LNSPALQHLAAGAARLGIDLTPNAISRFGRYEELFLEWNRRVNLVSREDTHRIADYHFLDSLTASSLLPRNCRLCDLGSGGGLPGIPLKIARDDISLVLIESIRKKALFLDRVIRELGLDRTEVWNRRAEDIHDETFDAVTCRLLGTISEIVPLAEPLLGPTGVIIFYKSVTLEAEIAQSQPVLDRLRLRVGEVRDFRLPAPGKLSRRLIVIARARPK
jgi:16S rRNA (guanine527-N7)-methyltransferase